MDVRQCRICKTWFRSRNLLHRHQIAQHLHNTVTCSNCNKRFINLSVLREHMVAHSSNKHSCTICGSLCKDILDLYIHLSKFHRNKKSFECDLCEKMYTRRYDLREHISNQHLEEFFGFDDILESYCSIHCTHSVPEARIWPDLGIVVFTPNENDVVVDNGEARSSSYPVDERVNGHRSGRSKSRPSESAPARATLRSRSPLPKQPLVAIENSSTPQNKISSLEIAPREQDKGRAGSGENSHRESQSMSSKSKPSESAHARATPKCRSPLSKQPLAAKENSSTRRNKTDSSSEVEPRAQVKGRAGVGKKSLHVSQSVCSKSLRNQLDSQLQFSRQQTASVPNRNLENTSRESSSRFNGGSAAHEELTAKPRIIFNQQLFSRTYPPDPEKPFKCALCDMEFEDMQDHFKTHSQLVNISEILSYFM